MDYYVFGRLDEVNFGATGVEEVLQNVRTYLSTPRFSVVQDRAFGVDADVVDLPINRARAVITADILSGLPLHEPRAKVVSIDFDGTKENGVSGVLTPRVKVRVNLDADF